MLGVDSDLHAAARLLARRLQDRLGRTPEHLNPDRRVKGLGIGFHCPIPHDLHVRLHRLGVRVDLDHRDFVAGLVHELVEGNEPRLIRFDELDKAWNAISFAFESARLEAIRGDEDERCAASASIEADPVTTAAIDFAIATRTLAPNATSTVLVLADTPESDRCESESRRSVSPPRGPSSAAGLTVEVPPTSQRRPSARRAWGKSCFEHAALAAPRPALLDALAGSFVRHCSP